MGSNDDCGDVDNNHDSGGEEDDMAYNDDEQG